MHISFTYIIQDVLTDITVSLKKLTKDDIGKNIEEAYVHRVSADIVSMHDMGL